MGGLVPRTDSAALGGLPFTSADFCDFRTHGPRISIDDLSFPSRSFVARVSASVATVYRCPGRGRVLPATENAFASGFAVATEVGTGSAEAPAAATIVAHSAPFSRSSTKGTDSVVTTGPTLSAPVSPDSSAPPTAKLPSDRISNQTHRRTPTAAGNEPPAVDYIFGPSGAPRPAVLRANTPRRVARPLPTPPTARALATAASRVPKVSIPPDRDPAEIERGPLLHLPLPPGHNPTAPTKLHALDGAAELLSLIHI